MEPKKILVVDDEIEILKFIEKALMKQGYLIRTTPDSSEADKILQSDNFALAIIDLRMPKLGGMELLQLIKKNFPKVEVIITTAHATVETAIECLKKGAVDYLIKPFDMAELLITVGKAIEIGEMKSQLVSLKEMDRLKDEFFSTVSHELKTPLMAISGAVEILNMKRGGENEKRLLARRRKDKDLVKLLGIIERQSAKMKLLVNDLLDFAKMEAGFIDLKKEKISIAKIINDAVMELQPFALIKEIEIIQEISAGSASAAEVNCDYENIKRVIGNLLVNSIRYTHPGGRISVWFDKTDGEIRVGVEDNGVGIAKKNFEKVFERFFRVDQTLSREVSGFGLGLSICRKIIELHGGKIWVESEGLGKGSTFMFTLPT